MGLLVWNVYIGTMKTHTTNIYGRLNFLSVFFPYIIFINWLASGRLYLSDAGVFWKMTLLVIPASLAVFALIGLYARRIRHVFVDQGSAVKRGIFLFIATLTSKGIFTGVLFFLTGELNNANYYWALFATFFMSVIHAGLDEGAFAFEQWRITLVKTEQLEKNNLQNRLKKLKEQVNPHFLFNSLNCLSSLISDDTARADKFLNEMSAVYRYLLNNNEESLVTMDCELKFIQSYFHLQKTRYGNGIDLKINVEEGHRQYWLPALTLQLLVENAIKHNAVMEDNPLCIEIKSMEDKRISITNNLLPRMVKPPSARIGLTNIINKYQILDRCDVEIESSDNHFCVKIPLIACKV
jgi:hypothetical protein